jgi:carbonic anhydrase
MMRFFYQVLAVSTLLKSVNSVCNHGTSHARSLTTVPVNHFSYVGLSGPLNWYGLNKTANVLCSTGMNQSPIDIGNSSGTSVVSGKTIQLSIPDYPNGAKFENLGTNVEVVVNGTLVDGSKTYALAQFHFNTPGEHRVNDEFYPMEMHFVFEAAGTRVISLISRAQTRQNYHISSRSESFLSFLEKNQSNPSTQTNPSPSSVS